MDTVGLKIKSYTSVAPLISIVRKYNGLPIGEIKNAIEQGGTVFEQDYDSLSGVRKVRKCYDELTKAGAVCEIFDEDEDIISREILSNLIGSHRITEQEVQAQMLAEAEDDDEI